MVAFATQVKRRRGTQEQNDAFTGAEGEIVVDLTNMTLRVHDGRTRGGFVVGGGAGRNIGDIFFTARTDTSLNGAVEANGGQYNTTDFVGSESIGNILSAGKVPYMTIADFDTAVANNGFCSLFGWDGGTVFKVPKIPSKIMTKDQLAVVGNGMALGLTNGTTEYALRIGGNDSYQQVSLGITKHIGEQVGGTGNATVNTNARIGGVVSDPEKSGIIATVDTVELRPMVQLANGATDEAVVVAGNVLADISSIKEHLVVEFQKPTADNNYTWYRKYADGWVEQGGYVVATSTGSTGVAVALPVEMADANYNVQKTIRKAGSSSGGFNWTWLADSESQYANTTTTVYLSVLSATYALGVSWQVSGMAAQ